MKDEQELFAWDAVRTTGGELSCSHIIHAVLPSAKSHHYQDGDLMKCLHNCFDEAVKNNMQSFAIPLLHVERFDKQEVVKSIVFVISERNSQQKPLPNQIYLIDEDVAGAEMFKKELCSELEIEDSDGSLPGEKSYKFSLFKKNSYQSFITQAF